MPMLIGPVPRVRHQPGYVKKTVNLRYVKNGKPICTSKCVATKWLQLSLPRGGLRRSGGGLACHEVAGREMAFKNDKQAKQQI